MADHEAGRVRIDAFLWACRFYKTRSLATAAVNAGHVELNGAAVKPAREVKVGDTLRLRREAEEWEVLVTGLADRRGSAAVAAGLYAETPASRSARDARREERRLEPAARPTGQGRPTKRDRRQIRRFTDGG